MAEERIAFFSGVLLMIFIVFVVWQLEENRCERIHNIYDCEWARTPFQPAPVESADAPR